MANTDTRSVEVIIKGTQASSTIKEMRAAAAVLNAEFVKLPKNTKEFTDKKAQLDDMKNKIKEITGAAKEANESFGEIAKGMLFAGGIEGVFEKIKEGIIDTFNDFVALESQERKLSFALTNVGHAGKLAFTELKEQAESLEGLFSHKDIIGSQAMQAQFGLTTEMIKKLTPQILDLARVQGVDLATATSTALKAIEGQTRGLKTVGITFADTGSKTENFNILTQKLTKFQGAAADALETTEGKMKRLEAAEESFKEKIGEYVANEGADFLDFFDVLFTKATFAEKGMQNAMEFIKKAVNQNTVETLEKAKESDAERLKLISETNSKIITLAEKLQGTTSELQRKVYSAQLKGYQDLQNELRHLNDEQKIEDDKTGKEIVDNRQKWTDKLIEEAKRLGVADELAAAETEQDKLLIIKSAKAEELKSDYDKSTKTIEARIALKEALISIENKYNSDIAAIAEKAAKEADAKGRAEAIKQAEEMLATYDKSLVDRLQIDENYFKNLSLIEKIHALASGDQQKKLMKDRKAILDQQLKEEKITQQAYNDELRNITKKTAEEIVQDWQAAFKKISPIVSEAVQVIDTVFQNLADKNTARANADLERNDADLKLKQDATNAFLKAKLLNETQANSLSIRAQREHDQKERQIKLEAARADKKLKVEMAVINGIASVVQTLAGSSYPYNLILAALDAVEVGLQISAIENAPVAYADGDIVDKPTYGVFGEAGPEALIPLSPGKRARGRELWVESGRKMGLLNSWMTDSPPQIDSTYHLDNIRQSKFSSQSGTSTVAPVFNSESSTGKSDQHIYDNLAIQMGRFNDHLDKGIGINWDNFNRQSDKINNAANSARVG